jgi:hypothetical protein
MSRRKDLLPATPIAFLVGRFFDHTTGDTIAGFSRWIALVIISFGVNNHCRTVGIPQRVLTLFEAELRRNQLDCQRSLIRDMDKLRAPFLGVFLFLCRILFAFSNSRLRLIDKLLPARLMKYWIIRMPEPTPRGLTLFFAIVLAIVWASFLNRSLGG